MNLNGSSQIITIPAGSQITIDSIHVGLGTTLQIIGTSGGVTSLSLENNNDNVPTGALFTPDHHGGGRIELLSDHAGTNKAQLIFKVAPRHHWVGGTIKGYGKSEVLIEHGKLLRNYGQFEASMVLGPFTSGSSSPPSFENFGTVHAYKDNFVDLGEIIVQVPIEDIAGASWGATRCGTLVFEGAPTSIQPTTFLDGNFFVKRQYVDGYKNAWMIFRRPIETTGALRYDEGTILLDDAAGTTCLSNPIPPNAIFFIYGSYDPLSLCIVNPACFPTAPPPYRLKYGLIECGLDLDDCDIVPNNLNSGGNK